MFETRCGSYYCFMSSTQTPWVTPKRLEAGHVAKLICLEPLEVRHAGELYAVADPALFTHSMQGPPDWSVEGFEQELDRTISLSDVVAFAITLTRDFNGFPAGHAVGRTTFMDIRVPHRGLEIGRTWIGRAFHSTRVNPEAKYIMLRHAFEELTPSAIRVQITTNGTNLHSQHAIEKLGAVREGVLRKARVMPPWLDRKDSLIQDWVYYSIVAEEWASVKSNLEARLASLP